MLPAPSPFHDCETLMGAGAMRPRECFAPGGWKPVRARLWPSASMASVVRPFARWPLVRASRGIVGFAALAGWSEWECEWRASEARECEYECECECEWECEWECAWECSASRK